MLRVYIRDTTGIFQLSVLLLDTLSLLLVEFDTIVFIVSVVPFIKKVGRKVFGTQQETLQPDKAKETEKDKVPFQQAPKQKKQSQNQSKNTQSNMNKNLAVTIGVGIGIVALVLIVAKLIK